MTRKKKNLTCPILLLVLLAAALVCYHSAAHSLATREDITTLLVTKQHSLLSLAQQAKGKELTYQHTDHSQWKRMDWRSRLTFFGTGLLWVDGTNDDGLTRFTFRSVYPEGSISLYHAPSGEATVLAQIQRYTCVSFDDIPEGGTCREGLGINHSGFVYCEQLQPDWYLVEWNLPT